MDGAAAELEAVAALERELGWLAQLIERRFQAYFAARESPQATLELSDLPPAPALECSSAPWPQLVCKHALRPPERLALVLALVPHLRPQLLDVFFTRNATFDRRFTEFGGTGRESHFEPTGDTLAFLLGGDGLRARCTALEVLDPRSPLQRLELLLPQHTELGQPRLSMPLQVAPGLFQHLLTGCPVRGASDPGFPALRLETGLGWGELVLHPGTRKQLAELQAYIAHGRTLMSTWGMATRLRPGYRALFHGPPGTGKTVSAAVLGKLTGRPVYRVDLSRLVSKYIGETEKNLARLFDAAEQYGYILLFDEADALFGKRSETRSAHDRYANQEVAYLLQRIESFDGIAILASNLRENLDAAFNRRFESVVYFPMPRADERAQLWRQGFSPRARLDPGLDLEVLARDHELAPGAIMNVIRLVSLAAIAEGERAITAEDVLHGIRRELAKEGRGT